MDTLNQQTRPAEASDWRSEAEAALADFVTVARLTGYRVGPHDFLVEYHHAPHQPPSSLPAGKMALYGFHGRDGWLKIGIAGNQSQARYTSHHYNAGSAPSTLAASLVKDASMAECTGFRSSAPGDWIRSSCHRMNVLVDTEHGRPLLALLEAYLHARLRPKYER